MSIPANNLRAFKIKYIGPTDFRGSRVSITDTRHRERVLIPYNHQYNDCFEVAYWYLQTKGIKCEFQSYDGDVLLTKDFSTKLKGE